MPPGNAELTPERQYHEENNMVQRQEDSQSCSTTDCNGYT